MVKLETALSHLTQFYNSTGIQNCEIGLSGDFWLHNKLIIEIWDVKINYVI